MEVREERFDAGFIHETHGHCVRGSDGCGDVERAALKSLRGKRTSEVQKHNYCRT